MGSRLSYLRSIRRFAAICFLLIRQLIMLVPGRVMTGRSALISRYLKPGKPARGCPEIAKETLEKLGPTYVKFGQFLSIRPDLIPPEFCEEFKKLQDHVAPFPFEQVKKELNTELKRDYHEVFSVFEETPLAAASISQVHRARLRTGEDVAVKVQRPGIRDEMASDIMIMLFLARLMERFIPSVRKNQPVMLVREFSRWTDRELYFRQEGKNALHFACNFRDCPAVRIPRVFREHTTRTVLVMERIAGANVLSACIDADRKAIARLIADSMLKQIFIDGFFHGDPHAGNILVVEDGAIAYLDFGIVGYLPEELRCWIFDILYAMSEGDVPRVIASFLELCDVREEQVDVAGYRREMNEVLSELQIYEAAGVPFSQMMERFLNTSLAFGIRVPHDFVLVTKAITTFEGTCLSVDPGIRIVELLREFVKKHATALPDPEAFVKQLITAPFEIARARRLVMKHGLRALKFLEKPTLQIAANDEQGSGRSRSAEIVASGLIIASLIFFAAVMADGSSLEQWITSLFPAADVPVLSLASLVLAALVWIRMERRRAAGS